MSDQASTLRKWSSGQLVGPRLNNKARVISFISGKGGVGKTNLIVNTAIALSGLKKRVVLVDADLSLGNVDVFLGLRSPYNLKHVIDGQKRLLEVMVNGPAGVKIVPATSGVRGLAQIDEAGLQNLMQQFAILESRTDIILFDAGAGIGDSVMSVAHSSEEVVVVTTPDPAAFTDAYATIKVLLRENKGVQVKLLVNMVASSKEAHQIYNKIRAVVKEFLNYNLEYLGYVCKDKVVVEAIRKQVPFVSEYPRSQVRAQVTQIASVLAQVGAAERREAQGMKGFFRKFRRNYANV